MCEWRGEHEGALTHLRAELARLARIGNRSRRNWDRYAPQIADAKGRISSALDEITQHACSCPECSL